MYGTENGPFSMSVPVRCSWIVFVPQSGVATAASSTCASEVLAPSRNAQAAKSMPARTGCGERGRGKQYVRCMGLLLIVCCVPRVSKQLTTSQVSKTRENHIQDRRRRGSSATLRQAVVLVHRLPWGRCSRDDDESPAGSGRGLSATSCSQRDAVARG